MPPQNIRPVIYALAPPLLAAAAVLLEAPLTRAFNQREAMLPVLLLVLLSAILHPRLRALMIVTLCYGVAWLALRDAFFARSIPMPPDMDYLILDTARPVALGIIAGLALAAAIGETRQPGTVWARRCYFAAAGLYFLGIGLINIGWHSSWRGYLLLATGLIAVFGWLYAPRIVASEQEEIAEETPADDLQFQKERDDAHQRMLLTKEWRDPLESPVASANGTLPEPQ